jgi:cell division protein FtsQ
MYIWHKLKQVKIAKLISFLFFITLIYVLQNSYIKLKNWLTDEQSLPLSSLILTGNLEHITTSDVRSVLNEQKERLNFFTLEIAQIQVQLENKPWVYSASIRKHWPDTLKIHIVEQSIIAVWNDRALLNRAGDIIETSPDDVTQEYVYLYGQNELSQEILLTYSKINQLLKVNRFKIMSLSSDQRNSTDIVLDKGIALRLGKEQKLDRIQRFLSVFPLIEKQYDIKTIDYLDLRYDTGLAIGWKKVNNEIK